MFQVVEKEEPIESDASHYILASYIYKALIENKGNVTATARALKITHGRIRTAITRYGIINKAKGSSIEWPYNDRLRLAEQEFTEGRWK